MKPSKKDLHAEARSLRQFLTSPDLIGWFFPWQHRLAVAFLEKHDSAWFKKNRDRILPPAPMKRIDFIRPQVADELLV